MYVKMFSFKVHDWRRRNLDLRRFDRKCRRWSESSAMKRIKSRCRTQHRTHLNRTLFDTWCGRLYRTSGLSRVLFSTKPSKVSLEILLDGSLNTIIIDLVFIYLNANNYLSSKVTDFGWPRRYPSSKFLKNQH